MWGWFNKLLETIFPTLVYVLKQELKDWQSVLDLGCGPDSPLQYCTNVQHSVGVEAFQPYLEESKKNKYTANMSVKKFEIWTLGKIHLMLLLC